MQITNRRAAMLHIAGLGSLALGACGGGANDSAGAATNPGGSNGAGSDGTGSGNSSTVAPMITTQPQPASTSSGGTATFTVVATSSSGASYQWSRGGVAIEGAIASSYTTGVLSYADNGASFGVTVTNSAGSVNSNVVTLTVAPRIVEVATHSLASFVRYEDGEVWGWGYANNLGVGDAVVNQGSAVTPVLATGSALGAVASLGTSEDVCFAIKADGTVYGWGTNGYGELGDGTQTERKNPVLVVDANGAPFGNVTAIAGGRQHTLAIRRDGSVWAWGSSLFGQLGYGVSGSGGTSLSPVQVLTGPGTPLTGVIRIAASMYTSMALLEDGTVWVWGYGALGNGTGTDVFSTYAVRVETSAGVALSNVVAIACGLLGHRIALQRDGTVFTWGSNSYGQLGDGTRNTDRLRPVQVVDVAGNAFGNVSAVAAGMVSSALLRSDGTVWTFGSNASGALGIGLATTNNSINAQRLNPVQVVTTTGDPLTGIADLRADTDHVLALGVNGSLWAWGEAGFGLFGSGSVGTMSTTARQIGGL